jgi:hypothetical protein
MLPALRVQHLCFIITDCTAMEHLYRPFNSTTLIAMLMLALGLLCASTAWAQPAFQYAVQLGSTGEEHAFATAIDASGNTYVTGYFNGTIDFDPGAGTANLTAVNAGDGFLAKYDASGNYLWAFRFGGIAPPPASGGGPNMGRNISVDGIGNVVLTGFFYGTSDFDPGPGAATMNAATTGSHFIARYSPTGNYLWAFQFQVASSGPVSSGANIYAMTLDGSGNIVVAGNYYGSIDFDPGPGTASMNSGHSGEGSMFVAKYSPSGVYAWAFTIQSGNTTKDFYYRADAGDIAVDASNNIYVVGSFLGTVNFNPSGGKTKLTSAGLVNSLSPRDMYVAKYSSAGKYLSAFRMGASGSDGARSIAIDGSGNLYVTGWFTGTVDFNSGSATNNLSTAGSASEDFVVSYTSANVYRWAFGLSKASNSRLAIDGNGNIDVAGTLSGVSGSMDLDPGSGTASVSWSVPASFVGSYTSSGEYRWGFTIDVFIQSFDARGSTIACTGSFRNNPADVDPGIGTTFLTPVGSNDIFLATYNDAPLPKPVVSNPMTTSDNAMLVAPNPFATDFTVRSKLSAIPAHIQVLDMMGRVVESREVEALNGAMSLGSELPAGAYIVRIIQGEEQRSVIIHKIN